MLNCTGTGARDLLPDPALQPFRGQVVIAENPGLTEFFIGLPDDTTELVYLFPHGDTVVLGGTEVGGDWNTEPVQAVAERILRDCAAIEPRVNGARVLGHRVGLRPFRPQVRVEAEPPDPARLWCTTTATAAPGSPCPGACTTTATAAPGVTLSWGCPREAAGLVAAPPG